MLASTPTKYCRLVLTSARKVVPTCSRTVSTSTHGDFHRECDVVIVGGGPAGLALASALSSPQFQRHNLSVALVEAGDLTKIQHWSPTPETFSNRVSSLTNASQAFLKDINAWNYVDERRTSPVNEMQVWDGISDARITFSASELDLKEKEEESSIARLTENFNLQRGLLRYLESGNSNVNLLQKTKVKSISRDSQDHGGWPMVHLDDGQTLRARLLVGADGFNSPVRSFAQISSFGWAYNTQAIVATLCHAPRGAFEGPNHTAYQRFLPTGPIAFLPLSPTVSSLVWSTKPQLAAALLACDPSVLASMINAAFRVPAISMNYLHKRILEAHEQGSPMTQSEIQQEILWREQSHNIDQTSAYASAEVSSKGQFGMPPADSQGLPPLVSSIQPASAASFPLRFNHADTYIGEGPGARTVLVGDAAHTVHPLAGQGLNLGLADVECLARCLISSLVQGGDIGSYTALLPYAQERYYKNHVIMSAIDKLHKIYSTDFEPIVWARSVGLEVLNELDSVKAALMMTAGAESQQIESGAFWKAAAGGIETVISSARTTKLVGGAVGEVLTTGLRKFLQSRYN